MLCRIDRKKCRPKVRHGIGTERFRLLRLGKEIRNAVHLRIPPVFAADIVQGVADGAGLAPAWVADALPPAVQGVTRSWTLTRMHAI